MSAKSPNKIDALVGANIRAIRLQRGLSQTGLGDYLGLSFQQVQKYERGTNRVGASRAVQIATALKVPVADLFPAADLGRAKAGAVSSPQMLAKRVGMDVIEAWEKLTQQQRIALRGLIVAIANAN